MALKLKCAHCGSTDIIFCQNVSITKTHKINKNGSISKKFKFEFLHEIAEGDGFVFCNDCHEYMNFDYKSGKLRDLTARD
jgi:hypothetical protein